MEKYEHLGLVGEGSYGMVMKCRNKDSGRIVAVKKFLESDDDKMVRKIAMREIKLLKQLRHENLVNLLEVCKKKKRWYLVFEFVDHTILDDLELFPKGLDYQVVQKYLFQIISGIGFCHSHNIIHRDIKPENILVSQSGVVKLCDFGFARTLAAPGEAYTDYVATRWYRAPELLVGDVKYGKAVDVWAIGCLVTEMLMGEALFPGESDIDQLYHIMTCLGDLIPRHQELFYKNPVFAGVRLPEMKEREPLERRYPALPEVVIDLAKKCLHVDPDKRPFCPGLLHHAFFQADGFAERFSQELQLKIQKDEKNISCKKSQTRKKEKEKDDSLSEERKTLVVQDTNSESKVKDPKLCPLKAPRPDGERVSRASIASGLPARAGPAVQNPSCRADEKTKYCIPVVKPNKHSPTGVYNMNVATAPVSNEKSLLQANKKRKEHVKADVHLPELNYSHLPQLKALEGMARNSRLIKKENRALLETRIPSLAAIDLHTPSTAVSQPSGPFPSADSEADLPRMEHQH
ncbi:cyclin-dependent kinase-like 2 [Perognathus longimembris pacificus]|uniref:cyclin-dependent kinase-like 2 n=1 Tax=Perognathus longimembris pacificus TaxID=214514 RepID=UPI002019DDED|nr:cyclin-dependent kinase-like 2 [Perognathus longimembris pacificus]